MNKSKLSLKLFKKLYLIRKAEEKIREHYMENEMKTPVHLSVGAEAIATGVIHALHRRDQFFGTCRSHGIYLARTEEVDKFFSELYGKTTGLLRGKGGSMHLCAPESGFLGSSAIVGSIIPVAVGAAYVNKQKGNNKIVAVFFGDGATDEGVFWESLNLACLMRLPVLFVCEDNELAVFTKASDRQGYKSLTNIVSQFNCSVFKEVTTDVELIYKLTCDAIQSIKQTQKPSFLHLKYYRYFEHVGVNEDFDAGYRSKREFMKWLKKDPITLQREKLIKCGYTEEEIQKIEMEIDDKVHSAFLKAREAPFPERKELYAEVLHEGY